MPRTEQIHNRAIGIGVSPHKHKSVISQRCERYLLPSPLAGEGGFAKRKRVRGLGLASLATSRSVAPLIRQPAAAATFSRKGRRTGASFRDQEKVATGCIVKAAN
jgi:hypothetical protein